MNNTTRNTPLQHFEQRGELVHYVGDSGKISRRYGWFRTTGVFDENIAYRKIGGRNWVHFGRVSDIVMFTLEEKAARR